VGAIVFWNKGAHPREVKRLFMNDFGTPDASNPNGNILVWLTGAHRCSS
jgi:hypothetical protein